MRRRSVAALFGEGLSNGDGEGVVALRTGESGEDMQREMTDEEER